MFDPKARTVTFLNGQTYSLASLRALGMGSLLDAMFDFSDKLSSLGLEPDEMALFMAVVLVSAGKTNTQTYVRTRLFGMHFLISYPYLSFHSPAQIALALWRLEQWSNCRRI